MCALDTMMPLLSGPWPGRFGDEPTVPLPGLQPETIANLECHWTGTMTPEMHQLLQFSCGLSKTLLGSIDFTGRWYSEEPLSVFRPSLTLAIDDEGRRWIAELGKGRGLPGPVWCVLPRPEVAMLVDRNLADFLARLHSNGRSDNLLHWSTVVNIRARKIWASRHAGAIALPVAFNRMRELLGWLAGLPMDALIYDLRASGPHRGLPYGMSRERGYAHRCGRLPVFAFAGTTGVGAFAPEATMAFNNPGRGSSSSPSILGI